MSKRETEIKMGATCSERYHTEGRKEELWEDRQTVSENVLRKRGRRIWCRKKPIFKTKI
jgi:hypothetical protein